MKSRKSGRHSRPDLHIVRDLLEARVDLYNRPEFIETDPIAVPHTFTRLQDIEISGFWTAILSWGQRKTILAKARELFRLMDDAPYDFVVHHRERDRQRLVNFTHRTFQPLDTLYFLEFLQQYFRQYDTLEDLFVTGGDIRSALAAFHDRFFDHPLAPDRTRKHIPTPVRGSGCKRLNMFLRWMVRRDDRGVDFGLWKRIDPSVLMIPLDVHVHRVAMRLGLLSRQDTGWRSVEELTSVLRTFDPSDPVKYDFALFGMGVVES